MILILNDDFEGGELIVNEKVVPKEKGMAILFDGSIFHEVTPVLFGERFVVAECAGKN
jgi:predicted 2-oxoglutarate/Fe(II)-dependent dioxygenase YbiX